ncbi:uncharacterized protein LOC106075377 [Biomphalaria glabrata]|uniref:Uncharacterized protein LOC106075377 n=1 Tax=Biomphalaria glabrata TaxID=6526 RepID=A0A9W3AFC2_BIOGL|nr:uncharacterized protein LOC106075377 [Biomphalaria glabrata]
MVWITQMQTRIVCWILLLSRVTLSLQESTNQTSQQGEGAGPGSGPSSENSDPRAANEDVREATVSGNKTFSTFRSLPSAKESTNSSLDKVSQSLASAKESTNSSLDKVSQSLTRLEGSLGSLIQSFLAMQRSVSNLEQLQELLVLLLEDILKQADNKAKSLKAIKKEIDTNYGDQNTKTSKESNEDDIGGDADRNNRAVENGEAKTYVNDEDYSVLSGRLGGSLARQADANAVQDKEETADSTPPSADVNESGASSREGSSTSDENDNAPRSKSLTGETKTSPPTESFNRSPQWAEPMSVERGNFLAMFREALGRLVHKSPASVGQQFQQMRLQREDHEINAVPGESPAEAPPRSFEPLEVKTDVNNFLDKESISQKRLPVQVRLRHLSQVVRHAGPIDGPEKSTSPFLEDLSGTVGRDYSGERPTGMINNLQLPESVADIFTNDSSEETKLTSSITLQNVPRTVRKRRQAEIQSKPWSTSDTSTNGSVMTFSDVAKLQSLREELNSSKRTFLHDSSVDTSNVYNITDVHNHSNVAGVPGTAWQDYDHLIDALLKDLSAKLQEYQSQQASNDAAIDRAVYELNKLIWVSTFENEFGAMNSSDTPRNNVMTGSESVQFISQPMISAADESVNKGMQLFAGNESTSLNETALHRAYTVKSRTKSALFKTKEMMKETENNSKISLQRAYADEQVSPANLSESSSSDWVWLTYMPSAMKLPEADLKWLIDTLTILTQRQDLATDMTDIIRRAWDLTHKKLDSNTMRHGEDRSAEAGPDDLQDEEELDVDAEGQNTRSLIRDNTSANSLFGDISEQLSNTPSNSIDESVQQVINALKHFLQQEDSLNNDQSHLRSTHSNHEKGSRGQDTLENEEGDSEELSREEDRGNHNSYMNTLLHGGQQRKEPEEYPMFVLQKQIEPLAFAEYFRNKRERRSRHKRLSGMLLKQFTNPQTPSDNNQMDNRHIFNQDGSHSAGQQIQQHQARNTSMPHSNGPQTMLHQNNLHNHLRRLSTHEPWGRLQRHYNYPWGYSNYMNHLGINHPNWIHRALEPDEPPSTDMQGSMDVEDAVAALFQRYWQRLFDVYSRSALTTTTEEPDYDGENTTPLANIQLEENITHITPQSPATITTTDILSLRGQPASVNIRGNTTLVK